MRINARLLLAVGVVVGGWSVESRADVTGALYEDLKGVVEDLLTDEVSKEIVPNLACYAGRMPYSDEQYGKLVDKTYVVDINKQKFSLDALYYFPQTLQRIYARQYGALRATVIQEAGDLAAYQLFKVLSDKRDRTVDKLVGLQEAKAANANEKVYAPLSGDEHRICREAVAARFAGGVFSLPKPSPLEVACSDNADNAKDFACEVSFALRAAMGGDGVSAEAHLLRASAVVITDIAEPLAKFIPAEGTRAQFIEKTVIMLRELVSKDAIVNAVLTGYVAEVVKLAKTGDQKALTDALDGLQTKFSRIRTQWQLASHNGLRTVEVGVFFSSVLAASGALPSLCAESKTPVCTLLTRFKSATDQVKLVGPIVRAISQKSYGDAANLALQAIFEIVKTDDCTTSLTLNAACRSDSFRTFLTSFTQYVIESAGTGSPTEVTRAALRASAVQVLRQIGVGGGFDRRGWRLWAGFVPLPGLGFIMPEFGLRASWSPSYVNRDEGRSIRYVASANLLTFKPLLRYTDFTYVALHISLADPLAPLSELATRRVEGVEYVDSHKLAWNILAPRLELLYGIPALSRHLVIGAGISVRVVAPIKDDQTVQTYRYRGIDPGNSDNFAQHLEFGFTAKYVL